MIRIFSIATSFVMICSLSLPMSIGQIVSSPFEFQFEGKTLQGVIEQSEHQPSQALVILIPGYGRTNFVEGNWFSSLRRTFAESGLTVCVWDKMGCGKSEGEFDAQQPVESSAREALAAIQQLKRLKVEGSEKIGLWGMSRAGWICPLIIEHFPIEFWISVSGTDDKENFGYLLRSNLIIAGKSESEANRLYQAWLKGHRLFCTGADYEACWAAVAPLREDSLCRELFGYKRAETMTEEDKEAHLRAQKSFTSKGHFDPESGLWVYIDKFDEVLRKIECPVLALFGENDSQVEWPKTKKMYERTIGAKAGHLLTTKVFAQCNHNLQKCKTCAFQEDLSQLNWEPCDQYYEIMLDWLTQKKVIEN